MAIPLFLALTTGRLTTSSSTTILLDFFDSLARRLCEGDRGALAIDECVLRLLTDDTLLRLELRDREPECDGLPEADREPDRDELLL